MDPNKVAEKIIQTYPGYFGMEFVPYTSFFYLLYKLMESVTALAHEQGEQIGDGAEIEGHYSEDNKTQQGRLDGQDTLQNSAADSVILEASQVSSSDPSNQNLPDIYRSDYSMISKNLNSVTDNNSQSDSGSMDSLLKNNHAAVPPSTAAAAAAAAAASRNPYNNESFGIEDEDYAPDADFDDVQFEDNGEDDAEDNPYRTTPIVPVADDLNRVSPEELQKAKNVMDVEFSKRQVKPDHPEYVYDRRAEYEVDPNATNEWDE